MTITSQLTLTQGEKTITVNLGPDALSNLMYHIPDEESMGDLYTLLAEHQSTEVRSNIAGKDHLTDLAVRILAKDTSRSVLNSLISSAAARSSLTSDELLAICKMDPELAASVASYIEHFGALGTDDVLDFLEHHPDPDVRLQLINNQYGVQKRVLQRMAKNDPDLDLRAKARVVLANR